jgi:hypothetical protein|mmetsp:Transcript_125081/g.198114  ORF Transcript_125081/g.198114 Transcript_125081/m.198114 type:complete len:268 (+) Transcript_125081:54-857(+)
MLIRACLIHTLVDSLFSERPLIAAGVRIQLNKLIEVPVGEQDHPDNWSTSVDAAAGAFSRDNFDLRELSVGSMIEMLATQTKRLSTSALHADASASSRSRGVLLVLVIFFLISATTLMVFCGISATRADPEGSADNETVEAESESQSQYTSECPSGKDIAADYSLISTHSSSTKVRFDADVEVEDYDADRYSDESDDMAGLGTSKSYVITKVKSSPAMLKTYSWDPILSSSSSDSGSSDDENKPTCSYSSFKGKKKIARPRTKTCQY